MRFQEPNKFAALARHDKTEPGGLVATADQAHPAGA